MFTFAAPASCAFRPAASHRARAAKQRAENPRQQGAGVPGPRVGGGVHVGEQGHGAGRGALCRGPHRRAAIHVAEQLQRESGLYRHSLSRWLCPSPSPLRIRCGCKRSSRRTSRRSSNSLLAVSPLGVCAPLTARSVGPLCPTAAQDLQVVRAGRADLLAVAGDGSGVARAGTPSAAGRGPRG